jgi:hypothetical protein
MPAALAVLAVATLALAAPGAAPPAADPAPLALTRLRGPGALPPDVEALAGRTVRLVGHMVHMELAPQGAFYLAARPVEADESGGGTGDLPLDAVRVEVAWFPGEVPWVAGPVEVIGRLDLGRREDPEGRVSWIRVVVEKPAPTPPSRSRDGVTPQHEGGRP